MAQKANVIIIGGEKNVISKELERLAGIEADFAASGDEAAEMLKLKKYDMAFLNLPDEEAIPALFSVRETGYRYTYMPVITLASKDDQGFFTEQGVNGVLFKPVADSELTALLRKWLPDEKIGPIAGGPALNASIKAVAQECGLNVKLALARLNGLQKVLEITMRSIGASVTSRNDKMAQALESGNDEDFTIEIHGIKSSFASIGAVELADAAAELEAEAKAGNHERCVHMFPAFMKESEELGEKLRKYFPKQ